MCDMRGQQHFVGSLPNPEPMDYSLAGHSGVYKVCCDRCAGTLILPPHHRQPQIHFPKSVSSTPPSLRIYHSL